MSELHDLIRDTLAKYPKAQVPSEIAQHVAKLTPADELHNFYEEALRLVVREVIRNSRNSQMDEFFVNKGASAPSHRHGQPLSYKVAGLNAWQRLLRERIPVKNGFKSLGECTVIDLTYAIEIREGQISAQQEKLDRYIQLREHLAKSKKGTLNQAPEMKI